MVIEKRHRLRQDAVEEEILPQGVPRRHLLQDEKMPLLVVLLVPRLLHKLEDPSCKTGTAVGVRHGDIRDMLPCLIRDAGDDLQHFEFRKSLPPPVEKVHTDKQDPCQEAIPSSWGSERLLLFLTKVDGVNSHVYLAALPEITFQTIMGKWGDGLFSEKFEDQRP